MKPLIVQMLKASGNNLVFAVNFIRIFLVHLHTTDTGPMYALALIAYEMKMKMEGAHCPDTALFAITLNYSNQAVDL